MKQPTTHPAQNAPSDAQQDLENNRSRSSTLAEYYNIEGTPFHVVKTVEGWILTLKNYSITEPTETKEEAIKKLTTNTWDIILTMMLIINDMALEKAINQIEEKDKMTE